MVVKVVSLLYEYEIRAMVAAFFPSERIEFSKETEIAEPVDKVLYICCDHTWTVQFFEKGEMVVSKQSEPEPSGRLVKNECKRFLYRCFSEISGKTLQWGTLTGVRPTKLPMQYMMDGHSEKETKRWLADTFLCSEDKIDLSVAIAARERDLLSDIDLGNEYSLYIGIPFCPTTCLYCSFPSYAIDTFDHLVEGYLSAIEKEMEFASTLFPDKHITAVYFGGGTPTALTSLQLDRLILKLKDCFDIKQVKEFTVEAGRPDSITRDKLEVLYRHGVSRISVNPQTMRQETLDLIGRNHTVGQTKEAFLLAKEIGFENINMDIIAGLPSEKIKDFRETLAQIKQLSPDSVTIHSLVVKRASKLRMQKELLSENKADNPICPPGGAEEEIDYVDEMLREGSQFAEGEGYAPYYMYRQKHKAALTGADVRENIGFARVEKEGIYNILIMEEKQTILGLGAGASSKFVFSDTGRVERIENVKSITDYIDRIEEMIERKRDFVKREHL